MHLSRQRIVIGLVVFLLGVACVLSWAASRDEFAPLPPVVYSAETDLRQYDIGVADGGGRRLLTNDKLSYEPAWSPNGQSIAYLRGEPGTWEECCGYGKQGIWVMNADGTGAKQLTDPNTTPTCGPQWSPNGESLLFCATNALLSLDMASTELTTLIDEFPEKDFSLSPDGRQVVAARPFGQNLYVVDLETQERTEIAGGTFRSIHDPKWSPDGKWIALTAEANGTAAPRLWAWHLDAEKLVPLEIGKGRPEGHTWIGPAELLYCYLGYVGPTYAAELTRVILGNDPIKRSVTTYQEPRQKNADSYACIGSEMDARLPMH